MSNVTRRQVIRVGVAASTALVATTASAESEPEKSLLVDHFLPGKLTDKDIQAAKDKSFTRLEFAESTFWVRGVNLGYGVPHTLIGIYAPDKEGIFHRNLFAESWAAGHIVATVDAKTGILELREKANSVLKGQIVLSCNLKTIGTQHSIEAK